jgi:hypothetical protein
MSENILSEEHKRQDENKTKADEILHRDNLHDKHHRWVQEQIESEREKRRMYAGITKVVLQWSIPAISGTIFYWLKDHLTF